MSLEFPFTSCSCSQKAADFLVSKKGLTARWGLCQEQTSTTQKQKRHNKKQQTDTTGRDGTGHYRTEQKCRQTDKQTHTGRQADRQTNRQTDRQTNRQADTQKQTPRQAGKASKKQTHKTNKQTNKMLKSQSCCQGRLFLRCLTLPQAFHIANYLTGSFQCQRFDG